MSSIPSSSPSGFAASPTSSAASGSIAGSDCGFGTFAGYGKLDPDISFKKLAAMAEGAEIASKRLWGR